MQLRRLMIVLAICIVGLVIAALGMYRSWQNFTSGGLFGILSSHGHYMMVDGTSTTVTLDHKAERIVDVGPNVADLVSELAGDSVVATTAAPYQVTNTVKQRVAPDVNAIVALKPDIVIIEDSAESIELVSPLRDKGIKVALLSVGKLLGRESKADSLIATMMNYIRDTESLRFAHRDDPKQTVAVYNENGLYGKPKTLIADMLTYVGVENAAVKSGVKASNVGTKADLIKADPDVIIVPMDIHAPDYNRDAIYANYYNDPALANLKAIKNKKVAIVSTDALLAKSYHIGRGIYTIAQVVYAR